MFLLLGCQIMGTSHRWRPAKGASGEKRGGGPTFHLFAQQQPKNGYASGQYPTKIMEMGTSYPFIIISLMATMSINISHNN